VAFLLVICGETLRLRHGHHPRRHRVDQRYEVRLWDVIPCVRQRLEQVLLGLGLRVRRPDGPFEVVPCVLNGVEIRRLRDPRQKAIAQLLVNRAAHLCRVWRRKVLLKNARLGVVTKYLNLGVNDVEEHLGVGRSSDSTLDPH